MSEIISNRTPELPETYTCKNCGSTEVGNFCATCGQKKVIERFNMRNSIEHLLSTMVNVDRGLWPTIIGLFKNPYEVVHGFLSGITSRYIHPFRYVLLLVTIQVFILSTNGGLSRFQNSVASKYQKVPENPIEEELATLMIEVQQGMVQYMSFFLGCSIPYHGFRAFMVL